MSLSHRIKRIAKNLLAKPATKHSNADGVRMEFEPGHFYSSVSSPTDIEDHFQKLQKVSPASISGVDMNLEVQQEWLEKVIAQFAHCPFKIEKLEHLRYNFENPYFMYSDGVFLHGIMRELAPKRVVEIGSGYSSAEMLDINELFFNNAVELSFIDPYPERLNSLLREKESEKVRIYAKKVQDVSEAPWAELESGDILFVDSSHVSKCGSDVNFIFFEIFPKLRPGVVVHVHDIFPHFEYPRNWPEGGRSWSEAYLLRAFLSFNSSFEILAWVPFLVEHFKERIDQGIPICQKNSGGSFWMRKIA